MEEDDEEARALLEGGPSEAGRGAPAVPAVPGALPALCDPSRLAHRLLVLLLMCFLGFGSYFCYDNPAALQTQVKRDMQVNTTKFMLLYAWYSWPNVVLCFFGGFLIDRVFGIRWGTIIFSCFVCIGQVIFALGGIFNAFWLMEFGRFIFGIGGESLAVAQNTYAVSWFKGKELNLVFGLQLSMARIGSTVNMNLMGWLYSKVEASLGSAGHTTLGITLMIGGITCILSLICALVLAYLDQRAERILHKAQGKTGEVIKLTDVKDFSLPLWLIFIICVCYYVAVFPFIGLGKDRESMSRGERQRIEGEADSLLSRKRGLIPRPRDHDLSRRQTLNRLTLPEFSLQKNLDFLPRKQVLLTVLYMSYQLPCPQYLGSWWIKQEGTSSGFCVPWSPLLLPTSCWPSRCGTLGLLCVSWDCPIRCLPVHCGQWWHS
ncbi:major facilitator superfamily domain-containing protein 1 isoform X3 [Ursus arctos]|uniref:major facilitator superfamily domain-containing protein 1 isoform X3 n=1 Tax=Ursus arctos TaxID=9644 RepID=UPI002546BB56|nr:major facilitator superfamily domain-containing protein 1 isoform X3 [Ursus arctos]